MEESEEKLFEYRNFSGNRCYAKHSKIVAVEPESRGSCYMIATDGAKLENIGMIQVVRKGLELKSNRVG